MPELEERIDELQVQFEQLARDVQILRPDIPRFGRQDFDRAAADLSNQLLEEIGGRTSLSTEFLRSAEHAELSTSVRDGATAFCTNGLKPGEISGSGTGVPVYFDEASGLWMSYRTDAEVQT